MTTNQPDPSPSPTRFGCDRCAGLGAIHATATRWRDCPGCGGRGYWLRWPRALSAGLRHSVSKAGGERGRAARVARRRLPGVR